VKEIKTAIILCGGRGSRLGAIGKKIPKTLLLVQKKPILWYILKELIIRHNFNHFILPIGHRGKMIKNYINKNFKKNNSKIYFDLIDTGKKTSISKRIYKVSNKIASEHFLLLNGDAIFEFALEKFFKNHVNKNLDLTMLTCSVISPFGVVINKNNSPINFKRDMTYDSIYFSNNNVFGEIFTGMSIIKTSLLKKINFKNFENFETNFYSNILKKKKYTKVTKKIIGFWYAMDNLKQLEETNINKNKNYIANRIRTIKNNFNE
jgi:glucose-1-phosphate cytidylyltransferase